MAETSSVDVCRPTSPSVDQGFDVVLPVVQVVRGVVLLLPLVVLGEALLRLRLGRAFESPSTRSQPPDLPSV